MANVAPERSARGLSNVGWALALAPLVAVPVAFFTLSLAPFLGVARFARMTWPELASEVIGFARMALFLADGVKVLAGLPTMNWLISRGWTSFVSSTSAGALIGGVPPLLFLLLTGLNREVVLWCLTTTLCGAAVAAAFWLLARPDRWVVEGDLQIP
jgi:hypothetical protein